MYVQYIQKRVAGILRWYITFLHLHPLFLIELSTVQTNNMIKPKPSQTRINSLPPEVFEIIFREYLSEAPDLTSSSNFLIIFPVYSIVRVCRLWMDIICGDPRLWSIITICFNGRSKNSNNTSTKAFLLDLKCAKWLANSWIACLSYYLSFIQYL